MAKYVLENREPYQNLFVGPYSVVSTGEGETATVSVQPDPTGLGYFKSPAWMVRYAGNEETGLRLVAAHVLNNVLGTHLNPTTNVPDDDISATGRAAPGCKGCHFDGWFALDPLAEALSRVQRDVDDNIIGFVEPANTPKRFSAQKQLPMKRARGKWSILKNLLLTHAG